MAIQVIEKQDVALLLLQGAIDIFVNAELHAVASQLLGKEKNVSVYCDQVEYCDTAAIQLLLSLKITLQARGKTLTLLGITPAVANCLRLAGVKDLMLGTVSSLEKRGDSDEKPNSGERKSKENDAPVEESESLSLVAQLTSPLDQLADQLRALARYGEQEAMQINAQFVRILELIEQKTQDPPTRSPDSSILTEYREDTDDVAQAIAQIIIALQFQDVVSQQLQHSATILHELQSLLDHWCTAPVGSRTLQVQEQIQQWSELLHRSFSTEPREQAVFASTSSAMPGTVELF